MKADQIFLSYSSADSFEAALLQCVIETELQDFKICVWSFERDQNTSERNIAKSLKEKVKESRAAIFLLSPFTLNSGATQWMELAYCDAFEIPVHVLLHHITYKELVGSEKGVPPLLASGQCCPAVDWRKVIKKLRASMANRNKQLRSES